MDWREFVETMSFVERKLREDPGGLYGRMDFTTRDHYRHASRRSRRRARSPRSRWRARPIQLAHEAAAGGRDGDEDRSAHVGFYLVDKGRARLERAAAMRQSPTQAVRNLARRIPLGLYLGAILSVTTSITVALGVKAQDLAVTDELLGVLVILLAIGTSQLAIGWVNWFATLLVTPRPLPRMDFSAGIPRHARTLVVVPTMLMRADGIESLVEALEVRFLANRDDHLHFGLLTDLGDASTETLPTTQRCSSSPGAGSPASTKSTGAAMLSSCSIVRASGTSASARGSAANESAASFPT
jgi:hypothetical protein